jgi:NAD+ diphosphatase
VEPAHALPFTVPVVDPCSERRNDVAWVTARWEEPAARLLVFAGERVAATPEPRRPRWFHPGDVPRAGTSDWVFLGIDSSGTPYFAADLADRAADVATDLLTVRELGLAAVAEPDFPLVITAVALLNWHRRHPRCPVCGAPTELANAGWLRTCPVDSSQHFPRVDPAVIMLVIDEQDRALLGRQQRWPEHWFSTLAGFVEPGETLETAVRREVREEVGVALERVDYLASQPWPFPSSLMLGFHARSAPGATISADGEEIAEARWFTRGALVESCTSGSVRLPPRLSISRWLIEQWYGEALPGDWSRA